MAGSWRMTVEWNGPAYNPTTRMLYVGAVDWCATSWAAETLRHLMAERYPIYGEADVTIESRDVPHDAIVDEIFAALRRRIGPGRAPSAPGDNP